MPHLLLILLSYFAKLVAVSSRLLNRGSGTSLPGLVVELYCPWVLRALDGLYEDVIMISGTNGKTTTRALLVHIYESNGASVCTNRGGANIMRGLAASLLLDLDYFGRPKSRIAVLEVEEATLPRLTKYFKPRKLLLTNIFRDQLDAYGEIDQTLEYFKTTLKQAGPELFLNLDDYKLVAAVREYPGKIRGFQMDIPADQKPKFESDQPTACPTDQIFTGSGLTFEDGKTKFDVELTGNLTTAGKYRLATNLPGVFNAYNALAAFALAHPTFGNRAIVPIADFQPVFGRGEKVRLGSQEISIMLVKNPAGFDQVLDYLHILHRSERINLIILINDRIADGKDVSWLWDVNLEKFVQSQALGRVVTGGSRGLDMLLRMQIAGAEVHSEDCLPIAELPDTLSKLQGPSYILATYTAMRDIRELLTPLGGLGKMHAKGN